MNIHTCNYGMDDTQVACQEYQLDQVHGIVEHHNIVHGVDNDLED